jgi:hypothetical protein
MILLVASEEAWEDPDACDRATQFIQAQSASKPFVWKAGPDEFNAAVQRGHKTLESIH